MEAGFFLFPFVCLGFGPLPELVRKKSSLLGIDFSISNNSWSEKPAEVCWGRISFARGSYSGRQKACSVLNWQLSVICCDQESLCGGDNT